MSKPRPIHPRAELTARVLAAIVLAGTVTLAGCGGQPLPTSTASNATALPTDRDATAASSPPIAPVPSASATTSTSDPPAGSPGILNDVFTAMTRAIAAQRPNFRFDLERQRLDGSWILDGNANDGFGDGRLFIVVTDKAGALTEHPCGDRDFKQGAPCAERLLDTGDRLILRDTVVAKGTKAIEVVLIHPDRSGISLEATNFAIDPGKAPVLSGNTTHVPTATRANPLYTVRDLADLAIAVDGQIQACRTGTC